MSKIYSLFIISLILVSITCMPLPRGSKGAKLKSEIKQTQTNNMTYHPLWPVPQVYKVLSNIYINITNYCNFTFAVTSKNSVPQLVNLTGEYLNYMFPGCSERKDYVIEGEVPEELQASNNVLNINIVNTTDIKVYLGTDESYNLTVSTGAMTLNSNTYAGFVRGLETFSQLLFYNYTNGSVSGIYIPYTPIVINDYPRYPHRGLMLDTARHFMSLDVIYTILDGLSFTKMNVFHWHITDSDSFPMQSLTHPNLTLFGAFSPEEVYTQEDINNIVDYAITRGIRIIPEIDSPSHLASWAKAPEAANLINCTSYMFYEGIPLGQINPTLNASYELVKDIYTDLHNYFPWNIQHLGCDEVFSWCWGSTQIQNFMQENNIENSDQLFQYYIDNQRLQKAPNTTGIYWSNTANFFLNFEPSDILQYWGDGPTIDELTSTYPHNRYILSNYDALYFDCGYGNYFGANSWCDPYHTWLDIYTWEPTQLVQPQYYNNIIGAEAAQWQELNNDYTVLNRIFPRVGALGERTWSPLNNIYNNSLSVFERLEAWRVRTEMRGVPSQPLTAGYCEKNPAMCF